MFMFQILTGELWMQPENMQYVIKQMSNNVWNKTFLNTIYFQLELQRYDVKLRNLHFSD